MQKIAQSEIITSVLIIALLTASFVIVWLSIDYTTFLSPAISCIELQTKSIITSAACYNQTSDKTQVRLTRNSEFSIDSIKFIIDNQEFICSESCQNCAVLLPDSSRTYELDSGKELKIFINNCELKTIQIQDC